MSVNLWNLSPPYSTLSYLAFGVYNILYTVFSMLYGTFLKVKNEDEKIYLKMRKWRWENIFEDEKMKVLMPLFRQNLTFYTILSPHSTKKLTSSLRTRYQIRHRQTLYCCFSTHPPPIRQNSKGSDTWLKTFFDKILFIPSLSYTFPYIPPFSPIILHHILL